MQPHGPYLIVGYSFGGLIMLELAHRLLERGEHVRSALSSKSYPHQRHWPPRYFVGFIFDKILFHVRELIKLPPRMGIRYVAKRAKLFIGQYVRLSITNNIDPTIWNSREHRLYKNP